MSIAVVKSIQVAGQIVEVLASVDGVGYRVQTDGTLASLKQALLQATTKAADIRTKPEIAEGMTVDFAPVVVVGEPPSKEEGERQQWFADYAAEVTQQRLATLSPELASRYKPEYGRLGF